MLQDAACGDVARYTAADSSCCVVTSASAGSDWSAGDDSGDSGDRSPGRRRPRDPFLPENRIPLPGADVRAEGEGEGQREWCGGGRRRNERERQRVRSVTDAFHRLRRRLPQGAGRRPSSKLEVLRAAIAHIHHLQALLASRPPLHHDPACHNN